MRFGFGSPGTKDMGSLLARMPATDLLKLTRAKLTRSTMPLLAWWTPDNVRVLCTELGITADPEEAETFFEYGVPERCGSCKEKGKGKPSFTDAMVIASDAVIAVEAKYTENLSQTVEQWIGSPPERNKQRVLRHWVECCIGAPAPQEDGAPYRKLMYQMLHRTASACHVAGREKTPHVVHLLFADKACDKTTSGGKVEAAVADLARVLHGVRDDLKHWVVHVPTTPGDLFYDLEKGVTLADDDEAKMALVRQALVEAHDPAGGRKLFDFRGSPKITYP